MELSHHLKKIIPSLTQSRHKGQNGKIGVIGGCFEYTGAPYYAAITSLKGGGDLAHIFCTQQSGTPIKSYSPEIIVHPLLVSSQENTYTQTEVDKAVKNMKQWLPALHGIVLGPGLGRDTLMESYLHQIMQNINQITVIDADGLWFLLQSDQYISIVKEKSLNIVLTPNVAEMQRLQKHLNLVNKQIQDDAYLKYIDKIVEVSLNDDIVQNAVILSQTLNNVTIIAKGIVDVVTNGKQVFIVGEQSCLKRCGGLGDILSGLTCLYSYWAQQSKQDIIHGCVLACMLSRRAAFKAYKKHGYSLSCPNVVECIGEAFSEFYESKL